MGDKLYLDNNDFDPPYEPTDSEDEYSEEEKEILKEARKGNKREVDPTQEILAFDESPDEDDESDGDNADVMGDSDIERGDEYDNIPDAKAWGKERRAYYNTDFVDQDYSGYNAEEEEAAQQEEEEAKAIQLRLAKQLDEADFFLDLPADELDDEDEAAKTKEPGDRIKLKSDLSEMSKVQKQQLFKKDSPEFFGLIEDFQAHLNESEILLDPILKYAKKMNLKLPIIEFARTRNNMILTYCTNVTFYLLLKSKRIPIKNHPITKRLVQLKNLLTQLQEKYDSVVKPELEKLLDRINSGEKVKIQTKLVEKRVAGKKLRMMDAFKNGHNEDITDEESISKRAKLTGLQEASTDDDEDNQEDEEGAEGEGDAERRGITYQIAKNKGLTPHRKKELRNPRVKHRSKFRKALIRRKGAVRTVRKETTRYGGEVSGIKATVKKGIKIKS